jgi:signal transduction histidine kinase
VQLRKTEFDLVPLVAGVVARHAARAVEKRQTLEFAPAAGLRLPFHGDSARLAQAIDNLVDNAVKYTPVGGAVCIGVERRGAHLCLSVGDTGPGLGAGDFARLFQPFQRLSAEPTAGESSTGLGLHITREFVAQHGGTVDVDSAPGRGTTFTVLLPAESASPAAV